MPKISQETISSPSYNSSPPSIVLRKDLPSTSSNKTRLRYALSPPFSVADQSSSSHRPPFGQYRARSPPGYTCMVNIAYPSQNPRTVQCGTSSVDDYLHYHPIYIPVAKALPDRTLALAQSLLHSAFGVLQLLRCDPIVDIVEPDWIELLHVLRRDVDWDGNRVATHLLLVCADRELEGVEENGLRRNLNIYIYDYCHKRGFKKTAHEPMQEANISPESNASTRTVKCALGAIQRQRRWQWVRGCYGVYIVTEEVGTHYSLWETARSLRDTGVDKETITQFVKPDSSVREILNEEAQNVKDTNLQDLLPFRFAIHHAGMSREDCGLVEELFMDGSIQVLVCTATFAWGINLPATPPPSRARKSTTPKKDDGLSCRPRTYFRSSVVLVVFNTIPCSTSIELPIESQFVLADNLNAEIVLGTIRNRDEAVQWIGYTYLYVRMLKSPSLYSVTNKMMFDEPVAKINVLLQAYISGLKLDGFVWLQTWMAVPAKAVLDMCKEVDKRMWRSMVPLRQFKGVPAEVIQKAEGKQYPWERYYNLQPPHIGELLGIPNAGSSAQTTTFPSFRTVGCTRRQDCLFHSSVSFSLRNSLLQHSSLRTDPGTCQRPDDPSSQSVDSSSEVEVGEKKEGILPGGGVALLKASLQLAMSSPGSTGGSTNSPVAPDAKPTASDPLRSTTNHSGRLQEEDLRCQERQEEAKGTRVGRDGYTTS
ncbi:hypothetical protein JOM56_010917 [Amanita muscaria]